MWTLSKIINIIRISWKNSPPTNKSEESFGRGTFLLTHTDDDNDDNDDDGDEDGDDNDDDDDDGAHWVQTKLAPWPALLRPDEH